MAGPIENIMVYVDGTEEAITAAQYAVLLARQVDGRLFACYVVNTRALGDLLRSHIFIEDEEQEYRRDLEADASRYLKHVEQLATEKGVHVTTIKKSGNVHQELIGLVEEHEIDLLVLGELPHIRRRRDEFYNEAERALRSVHCSVLVAKDEDRVYDLFEREEG
jgi:nucleotide-binding universal stress UspA family protein